MSAYLPWFKVYAAETLSDERFSGWTLEERGAWMTLLLHAWREGSIPAEQHQLARLLHVDSNAMRLLWAAIGDRFVKHLDYPDRLTSPRLELEREESIRQHQAKVSAGRAGATSRWSKENRANSTAIAAPCDRNATAMANDSEQSRSEQHSTEQTRGTVTRLPSKQELLTRQYPATSRLCTEGGFSFPSKPETRDAVEAAILSVGHHDALAAAQRSFAANGKTHLGWHLDAIRSSNRADQAKTVPPPDLDWINALPEAVRAEVLESWRATVADVEARFKPEAHPRALASAADMLRKEFGR